MYIKEEVTLVWKVVDLGKDVGKSTIFADVLNGRPQGYITIGSTLHDITSPFVFYKNVLLKILQVTEKYLWLATLLSSRLWHRPFPVNFPKILRKAFSQNAFERPLLSIINSTSQIGSRECHTLANFLILWERINASWRNDKKNWGIARIKNAIGKFKKAISCFEIDILLVFLFFSLPISSVFITFYSHFWQSVMTRATVR